jgi:hypothetical protein
MLIRDLNINEILVEESRFSLQDILFERSLNQEHLIQSFEHLGIIIPVIAYRDPDSQYHLIDGKKRLSYLKQKETDKVNAIILPETTPLTDIINIIFYEKRDEINESIINKIQFICFALSLNVAESWILQSLCIPLGFRPHSEFLEECRRINELPKELKLFCHEKRFSLKQILNLSYYPRELLLELIAWKSTLQLTASILDEIASNLRDYLKLNNKTIKDFIKEPEVQEIINSSLSPRDKTERLRQLISTRRFPILSETNARIEKTIKRLNLPDGITINWDRTLENKNVELTVHIQDAKRWEEVLHALNSVETKNAIENILDEL